MANNLPDEFCRRILADPQIPNPQGLLDELSSGNPCVAIRHNRLKGCKPAEGADLVPWCAQGEYLSARPNFTLDPRLHQGLYYVQDASSMAISRVIESLGLTEPVNYLDACAAPGGKTTAAIDALPAGSFVVANEAEPARAAALSENLMRWGYRNLELVTGPAQRLAKRYPEGFFDLIGADVPCSGEGMMRKDAKAVSQWTPQLVEQCAALQRDIIASIWPLLRPGGHLIYSTCTFAPQEDEENVGWICRELGAEQLSLPQMPGVVGGHFYPHLVRGEGLYMALLRKPGEASQRKAHTLSRCVAFPDFETKGRDQIPTHAAAMRADFDPATYPTAEVDLDTALRFLHRDSITLGDAPRGLVLLTYQGKPLGWVKNIGSRANNLLPKGLRILQQV